MGFSARIGAYWGLWMMGGLMGVSLADEASIRPKTVDDLPISLDRSSESQWRRMHRLLRQPQPPGLHQLKSLPENIPTKTVDYGGRHPFEQQHRTLQDDMIPTQTTLFYQNKNSYDNLRISFITDPIQARRGESEEMDRSIDAILNDVLPEVSRVWSQYLSVVPVKGVIPIQTDDCFGIYTNETFNATLDRDGDLVIFVGGTDTIQTTAGGELQVCFESTLAVATVCSQDQWDRPVVGLINFCLTKVSQEAQAERRLQQPHDRALQSEQNFAPLTSKSLKDLTTVAIHECAHILGMDSDLFRYFRDGVTGEPLTPRSFQAQSVRCVDGEVSLTVLPSESTVQLGQTERDLIYYDVVTPRVQTVVRNHFNCPSLAGARLENQILVGSGCFGAHWDERLFLSELMGALFSGVSDILSPLTLAVLEDSGWYRVSYFGSELSPYGHGLGCDFVNRDCIVNDTVPEYGKDVFCNTVNGIGADGPIDTTEIVCDPTHVSFAACDLFDVTLVPSDEADRFPPERVRYFTDTNLASLNVEVDYCPAPIIPAGVDCRDPEATWQPIYQDETLGPDSRCINAHFGEEFRTIRAACLEVVCDAEQRKLIVAGQPCDFDFQELSLGSVGGTPATMICPRFRTICPHLFCPLACSARGICNWNATPHPRCECFDRTDGTAACSGDEQTPAPSFSPQPLPSSSPGSPSWVWRSIFTMWSALGIIHLWKNCY